MHDMIQDFSQFLQVSVSLNFTNVYMQLHVQSILPASFLMYRWFFMKQEKSKVNSMLFPSMTNHNSHSIIQYILKLGSSCLFTIHQVLLVYDEAEVHKIVRAAHWVMDRLGLVEAVTSLRGLVVSFKVKKEIYIYNNTIQYFI